MGMRQNVRIIYAHDENFNETPTSLHIYSHWDGDSDRDRSPLAEKVRAAIARRERWDDHSYLARIIFSEIIKEDIQGETGYGLAPFPTDEEFPTIEVDTVHKTVNGIPYEKWVTL